MNVGVCISVVWWSACECGSESVSLSVVSLTYVGQLNT